MTETQHPSELESAMDNLETLLEAVAVARQKVRDRQRRAVPNRAPRRPEPEPVDWVEDAEEERAPGSEEASEQEPDSGAESAEDEQNAEAETAALLPGEGGAALPPASAEVRQLMAEMALTIKHDQAVGNALRESGFDADLEEDAEVFVEDAAVRQHAYRAAAEAIVGENSATALQAQRNLSLTGEAEMAALDAEAKELSRELEQVKEGLDRDLAGPHRPDTMEAGLEEYSERIAAVQEQQRLENERQGDPRSREPRWEGEGFTSEIRLPIMLGAAGVAAAGGEGSVEAVERYVEELGARLEDAELVVPVAGHGSDVDASVDPAVSAWRSVTAEDLVQAAVNGEEPANLSYLHTIAGEDPLIGPDGEVPAPGEDYGQIRPTEDGLTVEAGIASSDVSPAVWEQLRAEFGEPETEAEVLFVPVSADPHADPAAEISAAREDLPASLFAKHEEQEQQLLARREAATAAEDPAVWVQPAGGEAYVDLVEKQRPDGSVEAVVWVDEKQQPTTHPDGVPSVWLDEDGTVAAFGHYEDGHPSGTWAWTDPESGTFASDRAEMSENGPVPGTQQYRGSLEDGWTTVTEDPGTEPAAAGASTDGPSAESAQPGEAGLDAAPETVEPSPSPGPARSSASTAPPLPEPTGPSRGPRLH